MVMAIIKEIEKSQDIRLIDMFILGPFMVWYAFKSKEMNQFARLSLGVAGMLTILYNGSNYFLNEEQLSKGKRKPKSL